MVAGHARGCAFAGGVRAGGGAGPGGGRGLGELIFKLYRIRFTEPGVGKYLRQWGLTFRRPDQRAVEQDPEAVRVWSEETWPAIRARAKAEGAEVLFGDQVGIRSDQVTGRTWASGGGRRSSAAPGTGSP